MDDPNKPLSGDPHATDRMDRTQLPNPTMPERPAFRTTQAMAYPSRRRSTRRQNLIGGCLAIGGAISAFGIVVLIVTAILFPPWLRQQEGFTKEQWRVRFERINMTTLYETIITPVPADLTLPTPEFSPAQSTLDALLTPQANPSILPPASSTGTPQGSPSPDESSSGGIGGGNDTAIATEQSNLPTSTPSPTATRTPLPTTAPTATYTPTATIPPTPIPVPASYSMNTSVIRYQPQTWNNCSGATVSMGLSYFGYPQNQQTAADFLKPNREDKNVSPYQMVEFINQRASQYMGSPVKGLYRVGGDLHLLKALISNEFVVIIEKGYDVVDQGWMGHYLLLVGYNEAEQNFTTYDSYLGAGLKETYAHIENYWKHFNYTFVVIYPPDREAQLMQIMGAHADPTQAVVIARDRALQQLNINQSDNWAWFNLASAYTMLGNYDAAAPAFDQAFTLGMPFRTLWYTHTPYMAYFAMGRYDDILAHARATESTTVDVEETYYYRGAVLAMQGNTQGAIAEFQKALTYNSNFLPATQAITALQNGTFTRDMVLAVGIGFSG